MIAINLNICGLMKMKSPKSMASLTIKISNLSTSLIIVFAQLKALMNSPTSRFCGFVITKSRHCKILKIWEI